MNTVRGRREVSWRRVHPALRGCRRSAGASTCQATKGSPRASASILERDDVCHDSQIAVPGDLEEPASPPVRGPPSDPAVVGNPRPGLDPLDVACEGSPVRGRAAGPWTSGIKRNDGKRTAARVGRIDADLPSVRAPSRVVITAKRPSKVPWDP